MSAHPPSIPQRPSRSAVKQDLPQIPPRPHRQPSQSPHREAFTRSPLNDRPAYNAPPIYHQSNLSASNLPERPPSVQLPSIGHEGDEYATLELTRTTSSGPPEQKRNVASDLPMHQPKASLSQNTATSRIQVVTRTDSSQAAAAGIGKASHDDERESEKLSLRAKASFNRSNPNLGGGSGGSRPHSIHEPEQDHGIPEIGLQVPMYPNAGDVQAPSPAPTAPPHSAGIGFFNDGSQRNHHRRRSSRQDLNPPGSYGMHGHGLEPRDQFERAWYQRHPEELAREMNHPYDPRHPRGEWALSSDELNKLVHANRQGSGMGTSPAVVGTPDEQIGYRASEAYASRGNTPKPHSLSSSAKRPSSGSQTHVESPLRKTSFPFDGRSDDHAIDDEEGESVIKITPPDVRGAKKITGGGFEDPKQDLGAHGGNTDEEGGWIHERGYGVPILASDEIAKYPGAEHERPAVDPEQERGYHSGHDSDFHPPYTSRRRSDHGPRSSSRPNSSHGEPLMRIMSQDRHEGSGVGTPLHEIQEYEPLFPDDDENAEKKKPVNKHVRPDLARHHFPSQDIWEDNPDSLRLTATVSTPDLPLAPSEGGENTPAKTFETPEQEAQRKNGNIPSDRAHYLTKETEYFADPRFKPGVLRDIPVRPGLQPRFPSQDIWEDTPDSMRLETTVSTPDIEQDERQAAESTESSGKPTMPARPSAKTGADVESPVDKRAPVIPDRPKPNVPARPAAKNATAGSPTEANPARAKPTVPSRPAGKFASIKASFMSDLNSRLQIGPQVPRKVEEPRPDEEVEAKPLEDARKGRARGPARRAPAKAAAEPTKSTSSVKFSFSTTTMVFSLNQAGDLIVTQPATKQSLSTEAEQLSAVPKDQVGAEGDLPDPRISKTTLESQSQIQPALTEALNPSTSQHHATSEARHVQDQSQSQSQSHSEGTQTGQLDIDIKNPEGDSSKITTYLGGRAPEEGNVVVKQDGTQEVGGVAHDTPRKIAETGHGM